MSDTLRRGLAELAEDTDSRTEDLAVPVQVATRAWSRGRRRRRRTVAAAVLGVVAAALVLVALTGPLFMPDLLGTPDSAGPATRIAGRGDAGAGYPKRISHRGVTDDPLPARPGPLAAVLESYPDAGDNAVYYGVDAHGEGGTITSSFAPSLSPDGQQMLLFGGGGSPANRSVMQVWDLVAGTVRTLPVLADREPSARPAVASTPRVFVDDVVWDPTGTRLLARGVLPGQRRTRIVVADLTSGQVQAVSATGRPVGWASQDTVVSVDRLERATTHLRLTNVRSGEQRNLELDADEAWNDRNGLVTAMLTPDGRELVASDPLGASRGVAVWFSLRDGSEIARTEYAGMVGCGSFASDRGLVVRTGGDFSAAAAIVDPQGQHRLAASSPVLWGACIHWAADALKGPANGGFPFGAHTWWWTWYGAEIGYPVAALAALIAFGVGVRKVTRRRAAQPTTRA